MRRASVLVSLALLLMPASLSAQSVTLPSEVKVEPGRLATVKIAYEGDSVRWDVSPELDCFREYDPDPTVIRLRLIGYTAGKYRLLAIAAKGGKLSDFATCVVTVGDPGPVPPGPTPIPEPTDPLWLPLKSSFMLDAGNKSEAKFLASVYKNIKIIMDASTTVKDFGAKLNAATEDAKNGIPGRLLTVRRTLANDMNAQVKDIPENTTLSADLKSRYLVQFNRYATMMDYLAK